MKMELNLNGEKVTIEMDMEETNLLCSFLMFHTRERIDAVTEEEYVLVEAIRDELNYYLGE